MFKIDYRHLKIKLVWKKKFEYRYLVNKNLGCLGQWFSTFLVKRNPNETFQRLEEPLCGNLIVL